MTNAGPNPLGFRRMNLEAERKLVKGLRPGQVQPLEWAEGSFPAQGKWDSWSHMLYETASSPVTRESTSVSREV